MGVTAHCLAKVLRTGQTKNCTLSVGTCVRVCVHSISCPPPQFDFYPFIFVIIVPLCQTSCPLRTVHFYRFLYYVFVAQVKLTGGDRHGDL